MSPCSVASPLSARDSSSVASLLSSPTAAITASASIKNSVRQHSTRELRSDSPVFNELCASTPAVPAPTAVTPCFHACNAAMQHSRQFQKTFSILASRTLALDHLLLKRQRLLENHGSSSRLQCRHTKPCQACGRLPHLAARAHLHDALPRLRGFSCRPHCMDRHGKTSEGTCCEPWSVWLPVAL